MRPTRPVHLVARAAAVAANNHNGINNNANHTTTPQVAGDNNANLLNGSAPGSDGSAEKNPFAADDPLR